MAKKLSCGIVLQDPNTGKILCCHSTGKQWTDGTFDLPKGHLEKNEDSIDCVIRECKEETGLDISKHKDEILDMGLMAYTTSKNLHMFYLSIDLNEDLRSYTCTTKFKGKANKEYPEVNGYCLMDPQSNEINKLFDVLIPIVEQILERVKLLNEY